MIPAGGNSGKSGLDRPAGNLCAAAQPFPPNAVLAHWNCGRAGAMIGL
jgi:hypothetical protein